MINKLIQDISNYFEYLKKQHNIYAAFHNKNINLNHHMAELSRFNINSNPYCLYVKSSSDAWTHCIKRQPKVFAKCEHGNFCGTCYAGMGEYVFPIIDNDVLGFINIGGFCFNPDLSSSCINHTAEKYSLSREKLIAIFRENTVPPSADSEKLGILAAPLCHMFVLLNRELTALYGQNFKPNTAVSAILSHAVIFLDRNYMQPIQVKDVAAVCHCSISSISHIFKKNMGYSISAYINNLRIRDAKKLLKNTDFSIQQISELTGYSSSNYFAETFREETGISPREYRTQFKT